MEGDMGIEHPIPKDRDPSAEDSLFAKVGQPQNGLSAVCADGADHATRGKAASFSVPQKPARIATAPSHLRFCESIFDCSDDPCYNRGRFDLQVRALLFDGGRGVVVVPKGFERFDINRVVIAWDGSAAASRAVAAAMPFLDAAEEVEVACFVGEKELPKSAAGADLAAALARRSVNVVAKDLATRGAVAARLREQATFFGADMIVMGAFVHSPIREWLFGGVTQSMLEASPVPLLMAR